MEVSDRVGSCKENVRRNVRSIELRVIEFVRRFQMYSIQLRAVRSLVGEF